MTYINFVPKKTKAIRWFVDQYGFIDFEIIDIQRGQFNGRIGRCQRLDEGSISLSPHQIICIKYIAVIMIGIRLTTADGAAGIVQKKLLIHIRIMRANLSTRPAELRKPVEGVFSPQRIKRVRIQKQLAQSDRDRQACRRQGFESPTTSLIIILIFSFSICIIYLQIEKGIFIYD